MPGSARASSSWEWGGGTSLPDVSYLDLEAAQVLAPPGKQPKYTGEIGEAAA
ncbi:MAG: hypothetical protein WA840_22925 [Caulobacteraceae bacterium]